MTTPSQTILPILDQKKVNEFQATVPKIVEQANDLQIANEEDYVIAGSLLDRILQGKDRITEYFEKPAQQANSVHKFITGLRGTLLAPLEYAEKMIRDRRKNYRAELERQRAELEEQKRKEAKKEEEEKALQEAARMEEIGEPEAAATIIERQAQAPPPPVFVPSLVPKEQGKSVKKTWKYRVKDEAAIKREFMMPDASAIQAVVSKLGPDAMKVVGGIEVFPDETELVRRKA